MAKHPPRGPTTVSVVRHYGCSHIFYIEGELGNGYRGICSTCNMTGPFYRNRVGAESWINGHAEAAIEQEKYTTSWDPF